MKRAVLILLLLTAVIAFPALLRADEQSKDDEEAKKIEELKKKVDSLEARLKAMEGDSFGKDHIASRGWDQEPDFYELPNKWFVTTHGEFRTRALCEGNTLNGYTNKRGERVYAYDPKSTFSNDYGWWDSRLLSRTVVNFGDTAEIVLYLQLGDWSWGSQAATFSGTGSEKFDRVVLQVRELWARYELDPIPLYMEFGRMPWVFGNRIIQGNEQDGARGYYRDKYLEVGVGAFRQYEGENYEMEMKYNDDEDTFTGWINVTPTPKHKLATYLWYTLFDIPAFPSFMNPASPLHKIPGYKQEYYITQGSEGSNLADVGANYTGVLGGGFTINLEANRQFGVLTPTDNVAKTDGRVTKEELKKIDPIHFEGTSVFGRLDFHYIPKDTIALIAGWGSGDDPDTTDYEGFFAPDNDFGMRDETAEESIKRGYFNVYEFLSPGAGVPGKLSQNLGSGGIENTTFVNLAWDAWFQRNHHYYVSVGYIQASVENENTGSKIIGIENDARVDYIFSNNVTFSLYGGHLFILGDYFRKNAHDAASLRGEWKLSW